MAAAALEIPRHMTDLYAALDIPRDADRAAIRKAYRRASKKAHPDGGGSPAQFALVKTAHDILTDDHRRAHYDQTGEFTEKEPDNELAETMKVVSIALDMVLNKAAQNGALDYVFNSDVLKKMRDQIYEMQRDVKKQRGGVMDGIDINQRLLKQFRIKKSGGANLIEAMLTSRVATLRAQVESLDKQYGATERAFAFLADYEFQVERLSPEEERRAGTQIMMNAMSGLRF